jgi:alkylation response protein AidB-like acyl-CoA dehydrogenase
MGNKTAETVLGGNDVLREVQSLRAKIEARAPEIEAARQLPMDLVEALRSCGVFRMYVPKTHGGLELDFLESLEVIIELAAADGSVGWTAMIGCATPWMFAGLQRKTFDTIYASTPDVIHAGSTVPSGTAERVPGGYRVTGRWPFASGCRHADWMLGVCVVTENGTPVPGRVEGAPLTCMAVCPATDWQIEDTWRVAGMKGTGSHHIAMTGRYVSEEFTYEVAAAKPCVTGPHFNAIAPLVSLLHAALAVGLAEGARTDLLAMVRSGRRQFRAATAMAESPIFQYEFARAEADLRAARAYLQFHAASTWRLALAALLSNKEHGPEAVQAAVWITAACARAVDAFYTLGGGSALYESSPLQRRFRDMHVATQHVQVQLRNYETVGKMRLQEKAEAHSDSK